MSSELVLESLNVENFRSIRGEIVVPIKAPVVLIHGPNGTGKSSLMTALALALAGPKIGGVAEPKHLVHHGAECASIKLATSRGPKDICIRPTDSVIESGALTDADSAFFAERCYLEQTKLTRLLDLYQETGKGSGESALTRFVKELLRLDELDALIDGLHLSGDVRRVEAALPSFKAQRADIPRLEKRLTEINRKLAELSDGILELESSLENGFSAFGLGDGPLDDASLEEALDQRADLQTIAELETLALRIEGLSRRRAKLDSEDRSPSVNDAEAKVDATKQRREMWQKTHGHALGAVISDLRSEFPRLPSLESIAPSEAYQQALETGEAERQRIAAALTSDDEMRGRHDEARLAIEDARARLELLDRELADEAGPAALGEFARLLSDLASHVVSDECPVCGRDFSEISEVPLSAHLAAEIARLSERAGQLQSAARARLETTTDLQREEEGAARLIAQSLTPQRRDAEERRLKALAALVEKLREHEVGAREGGNIMREVIAAEGALSDAIGRDRAEIEWRGEFEQLTVGLLREPGVADLAESVKSVWSGLRRQIDALKTRQAERAEIGWIWNALRERRARAKDLSDERVQIESQKARQTETVATVRLRMENARGLLHRVEAIRRSTISGIFNSALNKVWAELFVRLAPDEEYVPAFCEPGGNGPVTARLETRRRDGTPAGTPSEMLSAGNLNTAALTLFLALHLSVKRRLPWLLLDDPVQSMDEIHVAQFAALLRTLTQGEPERRIFIAVHERALFEYLALELSPPNPAGGLVTVELRRDRSGDSTAQPKSWPYKPDTALLAA